MPEYSYDKDDQRFQDDRPYYDFDEREWLTNSLARNRATDFSDRPSSKPWWIEMGVDMPDAPPIIDRTPYQDPDDDDMSRIPSSIIPSSASRINFFLYPYVYRNSSWFQWSS